MGVSKHPEAIRQVLAESGLSRASELRPDEIKRAKELADGEVSFASEEQRRRYIMNRQNKERGSMPTKTKGKKKSAKSGASSNGRGRGRPAKEIAASTINQIAKMRREGATWAEVRDETGVSRNSTGFRTLLESKGFDRFGRKDGKGESKARGWGSSANGETKTKKKGKAKAKKGRRRKTKAADEEADE